MDPAGGSSASPSGPTGGPGEGPRTLGFLFCDLRDYTAFVETHGDLVAAELLERYRSMVREAVARATGAEIRTEGDSFFVVFSSASSAVRCGLEIVAEARRESERAPSQPMRVGVGIHAGEAVEGDEGYVGSAVNIAARVCAQAGPGEVLVTATVRGLVRTSLDAAFVPRGHPRLKGIAEPIAIYRVERGRGSAAGVVRPVRRTAAVAGLVGVAAVALIVASAVLLGPLGAAGPSRGPSTAPASLGSTPSGDTAATEPPLSGRLAFIASQVVGSDPEPRQQLYVQSADGGGRQRVSELTDQAFGATWAPDGHRLAYLVSGEEDLPPRIVDVATAPASEIWPWPWGDIDIIEWESREYALASLSWSSRGELLVGAYTYPFRSRIFAAAADGSTGRLVTEPDPTLQPGIVNDGYPAVSPDGLTVAFISGTGSRSAAIWAAAIDGSGRIQVTSGLDVYIPLGVSSALAWSPDGSRIAFAAQQSRDGPIEIWVVDAQGTRPIRLTDDEMTDRSPAWSPDGSRIAWVRTVAGQRQIWVMAADGTGARPLIVGAPGEQLDLVGWAPAPE